MAESPIIKQNKDPPLPGNRPVRKYVVGWPRASWRGGLLGSYIIRCGNAVVGPGAVVLGVPSVADSPEPWSWRR